MTPKEAIERLKHWPEMTELEKLHWLRVAVQIKEAMIVSGLAGRPLPWEDSEDYIRLYEEILAIVHVEEPALVFRASGNLTPADGELWEVWRELSADPHGLGGPTPPGTEVPAQSAVSGAASPKPGPQKSTSWGDTAPTGARWAGGARRGAGEGGGSAQKVHHQVPWRE